MMNKKELLEIIINGENSGVEFKRDDLKGGMILLQDGGLLHVEKLPVSGSFIED